VLLFENPYKARYEVELGTRENLPYTYRVRRDSPPSSDGSQGEWQQPWWGAARRQHNHPARSVLVHHWI